MRPTLDRKLYDDRNPTLPEPCKCDESINHGGVCMKCGRDVIAPVPTPVDDTAGYTALAAAIGPPFTTEPSRRRLTKREREREQPGRREIKRRTRIEQVKRLRAEGLKDVEIAREIGLSHQALYQWLKAHEHEFEAA